MSNYSRAFKLFVLFVFGELCGITSQPDYRNFNGSAQPRRRRISPDGPAAAHPPGNVISPRNVFAVYYQADEEPNAAHGRLPPDTLNERLHLTMDAGATLVPNPDGEVFTLEVAEGGQRETVNAIFFYVNETPFLLHRTGNRTYSRINIGRLINYNVEPEDD